MGSKTALHTRRYEAFRARLRRAREESGMTQAELARAVRRSQTWVSKCELGERAAIEAVAYLLETSLKRFRPGEREGRTPIEYLQSLPGGSPRAGTAGHLSHQPQPSQAST